MPKTLLLADDSVVIQKLVGLSFANEDVELVTTDNGDDAVVKARESKPDIVLADVVMPGMSGYEVCEAIKADPELARTPVILLTGTFEAFDEDRARSVGSDGHITKPFEAQALVERVNDLLSRAPEPPAAGQPAQDFDFFDGTADAEQSGSHDVTRAAPASQLDPLAPAGDDPLANQGGYDFGDDASGLPPLGDSDPLAAPLDLGTTPQPNTPLPTAEDDLLSTSNPMREGPTVTHIAPETHAPPVVDVTPALEVDPVPAQEAAASEPVAPAGATDDLMAAEGANDPSLTTIIMSDGASSSDGVELGEAPLPVRSLDDEPAQDDAVAGGERTMLADDLFGPGGEENSDSGFDFGASAEASGSDVLSPTAQAIGPPDSDPLLGRDPLAAPTTAEPSGPPSLAGNYDVSTSELVDPVYPPGQRETIAPVVAAVDDDATVFAPPGESLLEATPADDIELSDGILGEPVAVTSAETEGEAEAVVDSDPSAPISSGPDITPVMRDRIHDTLERVAWEAFADLPDALIKQVVERVEAIAWEVIPQMAEALIKEEIRRMKGDTE